VEPGTVTITARGFLPRGVYLASSLSSAGNLIYFAVDYLHREVGARVELDPDAGAESVVRELWRKLDAADPEHSRARERARRRGEDPGPLPAA
jgi:hypothetical protein